MSEVILSRSRPWARDDEDRNRALERQADAFERMAAAFEEIAGALSRMAQSPRLVLPDEPETVTDTTFAGRSVEVPYRREPGWQDGQTGPDDADIRDFS